MDDQVFCPLIKSFRPLLTVLGDLALVRPDLVLMQGRRYWRVETLLRQARRDAAQPRFRGALEAPFFFWEEDAHEKLVVYRDASGVREAVFVEPGSDVRTV